MLATTNAALVVHVWERPWDHLHATVISFACLLVTAASMLPTLATVQIYARDNCTVEHNMKNDIICPQLLLMICWLEMEIICQRYTLKGQRQRQCKLFQMGM